MWLRALGSSYVNHNPPTLTLILIHHPLALTLNFPPITQFHESYSTRVPISVLLHIYCSSRMFLIKDMMTQIFSYAISKRRNICLLFLITFILCGVDKVSDKVKDILHFIQNNNYTCRRGFQSPKFQQYL